MLNKIIYFTLKDSLHTFFGVLSSLFFLWSSIVPPDAQRHKDLWCSRYPLERALPMSREVVDMKAWPLVPSRSRHTCGSTKRTLRIHFSPCVFLFVQSFRLSDLITSLKGCLRDLQWHNVPCNLLKLMRCYISVLEIQQFIAIIICPSEVLDSDWSTYCYRLSICLCIDWKMCSCIKIERLKYFSPKLNLYLINTCLCAQKKM